MTTDEQFEKWTRDYGDTVRPPLHDDWKPDFMRLMFDSARKPLEEQNDKLQHELILITNAREVDGEGYRRDISRLTAEVERLTNERNEQQAELYRIATEREV